MRTEIDVLLNRVEQEALRAELRSQIARLQSKRTFGLVFERHHPERVRLREHPLRPGMIVALKDDLDSPGYEVLSIEGGMAVVRHVQDSDGRPLPDEQQSEVSEERLPANMLVVLAGFGEPIYAGIQSLGSVGRGGDKPSHVVVKGENYHVLEALQFTHLGKIDCIYIDPPYNSGARDWKYDNHYVDENDAYRHSKWLAFMERRLLLAKRLLNPESSVLIVTIDEKEYLRLGLLLEQMFGGSVIQMVTSVIKPEGTGRVNEFSRTNEFIFLVMLGTATLTPTSDNMFDSAPTPRARPVEWRNLRRRERESVRGSRPRQFYAVFVEKTTGSIVGVGDELDDDVPRETIVPPDGARAVFPLTPDGREMVWSLIPARLRDLVARGFARASGDTIQFLNAGTVRAIDSGEAVVTGRDSQGAVTAEYPAGKRLMPKTVWSRESHNAQASGTLLLRKLLPQGGHFPFPKSLYAVEDTIRFFVKDKPEAVVLDFFGGSGTTTHAVARLNHQDGGRRQTILVTNNEVSLGEAESLRRRGFQPGDSEWEELGIFEHITRPRIEAAVTGRLADGEPVSGEYKFVDEFAMSEGFSENVEFLALTYLNADDVELDRAFNAIAPLLWLRAGAHGPIITECRDASGRRKPYAWTEHYGVLFNLDRWRRFVENLPATATTAFIVTDSQTTFQGVAAELPDSLDVVRLYENYITTFTINQGLP